jgi:ubiquinone/menaquinone biosynthesis C-methylase UbiE
MTAFNDRHLNRVLGSLPARKFNQGIQKHMYRYMNHRFGDDVLFMNWSYEEDPPVALTLDADDEPNRYPIQLYHFTATQAGDLAGKLVLEVGCGRGGGASYLTRALAPASYVGLDLNTAGIEFCRRRHRVPGLEFVQGDAENLPFPGESFDAVINIESSHCYPQFGRFLSEVGRVLRPGGMFLYADARPRFAHAQWEAELAGAPGMRVVSRRDIDVEVLRGMGLNSAQMLRTADSLVPGAVRWMARKAAPARGSKIYQDLESGRLGYRMYCLVKATCGACAHTSGSAVAHGSATPRRESQPLALPFSLI